MKANGTPAPKPEQRPGINIVIHSEGQPLRNDASVRRPPGEPGVGGLAVAVTRYMRGMRENHRGFAFA